MQKKFFSLITSHYNFFTHFFYFPDLTLSDSGLYTCQAKSRSGQAVWSASLQVADPNLNPTVTFNSMPYLSQFPASPSKPQMVNATATSITLKWDKPHRIGGSALQGYQVKTVMLQLLYGSKVQKDK